MPTYSVKAPNGKTYSIQGPKGATQAQVRAEILRQYPEAGGRAAKKETSFWQGVGEGLVKPITNAARIGLKLNPQMNMLDQLSRARGIPQSRTPSGQINNVERAARDKLAQSGRQGSTLGKLTGEIVGTAPTMFIPGGPFIQGAASGVMLTEDMDNPLGVLRDALFGGVASKGGDLVGRRLVAPVLRKAAPVVSRSASKIVPKTARKTTAVTAAGSAQGGASGVSQRLAAALDDRLQPLGRDAAVRAARLKAVGVQKPTTGMVTRDPRAWQFEREGAKLVNVGDGLLQQLKGVSDDLVDAGKGLVDNAGGRIGPELTGQRVSNALSARNQSLQESISGLYKQARSAEQPVQSLDNLWGRMADPTLRNNPKIGQMGDAVTGLLKDFGVIDDVGANIPGRSLTTNQAEELRKFIGQLGEANDPTSGMARKGLQQALDADVLDNVGDDAFREARQAASARFSEFQNTYPGKLIETNKPEIIGQQVLRGNPSLSDLRALRGSLEAAGDSGAEALQALRAQAIDDLLSPNMSREAGVSGKRLADEFGKRADRLRIILEPDQYKQLRRLSMAARDATADVPFAAVNHSNSASSIANLFPEAAARQRGGIFSRLAKQGAAYMVGGPALNVGLMVAEDAAGSMAEKAARNRLAQQAAMAADPALAANALTQAQMEALQRAIVSPYAKRIGQGLSLPVIAGGISAFSPE